MPTHSTFTAASFNSLKHPPSLTTRSDGEKLKREDPKTHERVSSLLAKAAEEDATSHARLCYQDYQLRCGFKDGDDEPPGLTYPSLQLRQCGQVKRGRRKAVCADEPLAASESPFTFLGDICCWCTRQVCEECKETCLCCGKTYCLVCVYDQQPAEGCCRRSQTDNSNWSWAW